jgi:ubiquitin-conjugating enzyme E2 variant
MDIFWVALAGGLAVGGIARHALLPVEWGWIDLFIVAVAIPGADFVSGMVHWAFDTWGSEQTFFIGPRLIKPFRVHHEKPKNLLDTHFFTTNSDSSLANLPFLLLAVLIPVEHEIGRWASLFFLVLGIAGLPTSQIHKWAHMRRPPRFVAWLQRRGIILSTPHHDQHHRPPHTVNYCITTGWCNPLLGRIRFFSRLERLITAVTGVQPRQNEAPHPGPVQ